MKISEGDWSRKNLYQKFCSVNKLPKHASFVSSGGSFIYLNSFSCLFYYRCFVNLWDQMQQNWATGSQFFTLRLIMKIILSSDSFLSFADWKHLLGKGKSLVPSLLTVWILFFFFRRPRRTLIKARYELYSDFPHFYPIAVKISLQRNLVQNGMKEWKTFYFLS